MPLIERTPSQVFNVPLDQFYAPPTAPVVEAPPEVAAPVESTGGPRSTVVDPAAYIPSPTAAAPAAKANAPVPIDATSPFQQFVASRNVPFDQWNTLARPLQEKILKEYHESSTFQNQAKDPLIRAQAVQKMKDTYITSAKNEQGLGAITDTLLAFGKGLTGATKSIVDAFPGQYASQASKFLSDLDKGSDNLTTNAKKEGKIVLAYDLANIPESDIAKRAEVMARYLANNPAESVATALGSLAPVLLPGGAAAAIASRVGAGAKVAGTVFNAVNLGTGAAAGAGAVRGGAMEEIKNASEADLMKIPAFVELRKNLNTDQARAKLIETAGSYAENGGKFAVGGAASAILNRLGGAESAVAKTLTRGAGATAVKDAAVGKGLVALGKTTLKESVTETAEGGTQKVLANSVAGVDLQKGLGEDLASNAILGGIGGGSVAGLANFRTQAMAKQYIARLSPEERASAGIDALASLKSDLSKNKDTSGFEGGTLEERSQNAQTWAAIQSDNKKLSANQKALLNYAAQIISAPTVPVAAPDVVAPTPTVLTPDTPPAATTPLSAVNRMSQLRAAVDALKTNPEDVAASNALQLLLASDPTGQQSLFNDGVVNAPPDPVIPDGVPTTPDTQTGQLFTDPSGQQPLFNDGVVNAPPDPVIPDGAPTTPDTQTGQLFTDPSGQQSLFNDGVISAPKVGSLDETQSVVDQIKEITAKRAEVTAYGNAVVQSQNPIEQEIWLRADEVLKQNEATLKANPAYEAAQAQIQSELEAAAQNRDLFRNTPPSTKTPTGMRQALKQNTRDPRIAQVRDVLRSENNPAVAGQKVQDILRGGPAQTGGRFQAGDLNANTAPQNPNDIPETFWQNSEVGRIDKALYRAAVEAGDVQGALRVFKQSSPQLEVLINKLALSTPKGVVLTVGPVKSAEGARAAATYNPAYNRITIDPEVADSPYYLLHEMVHAATARAMMADPSKLSPNVRAAVERINDLYLETVLSRRALDAQRGGAIYGLSNPLEFTAEVLSNKSFRDFLDTIPSRQPRKSLVTRFFNAVKSMLGFNETSIAGQTIMALDTVMSGNLYAPIPVQQENAEQLAAVRRDDQQITDYYEFRSYKDPALKATATLESDGSWTYQVGPAITAGLTFDEMANIATKGGLYIRNKGVDTGARTKAAVNREALITPGFQGLAKLARDKGIGDGVIASVGSFIRDTKFRYYSGLEGLKVVDQIIGAQPLSGDSVFDKFAGLQSRIRSEITNQGFGKVSLYDAKKKAADLLKNSGIDRTFFEDYYYARAAAVVNPTLKAKGLYTSNGLPKTSFSGFSYTENGKEVIDDDGSKFLNSPRVKANEKILQDIAAEMQKAEQLVTEQEFISGRISMQTFLDRKQEAFYAPLRNQKDDNPASLGSMRAREGRFTKADPPFSLHLKSLDDRMSRAMRTQLHNELADIVSDNQSQLADLFSLATTTMAPASTITQHKDGTWTNRGESELENAGEIWVYNDGVPRVLSVVDPNLKKQLTKYDGDRDASAKAFYAASQVTRVFTGTLTRWNPAFLAKTALMWDPLLAFANAQGAFQNAIPDADASKFARSVVGNALSLMSKVAQSNAKGGDTDDPMLRLFNASGGGIDALSRYDINTTRTNVGLRPDNLLSKVGEVAGKVQVVLHSSDTAFRAAAFKSFLEYKNGGEFVNEAALQRFAQDNPKLVETAALGSKNILTNYEQKGNADGFRSWVPFFNAAVQSAYATIPSVLGSSHGRNTVYTLMALSALAIAAGMGEKDEEGKDKMFRQKSLGAKIALNGMAFDVPPEFRPMVAMSQGVLGVATGNMTMSEAIKLVMEKTIDNFTPFKVTGLEGDSDLGNRFAYIASGPFPILAQLVTQRDYFGKDVANKYPTDAEGKALKGAVPDALKGRYSDAPWSKDIAQFLASSGGPDMLPSTYEGVAKNVLGGFYTLGRDTWKSGYEDPAGEPDSVARGVSSALLKPVKSEYDTYKIPQDYAEQKANIQKRNALTATPTTPASSVIDETEKQLKDIEVGGLSLPEAYKQLNAAQRSNDGDTAARTRVQIQLLQTLHRQVKAQALIRLEDEAR